MRLGISSYTYGWSIGGFDGVPPPNAPTALDLIDRATAMNVRVLQIADNLAALTWDPEYVEKIASRAVAQGVSIEVGTRGCRPEHLRRFISIAERLKSPILRVVLDADGDHPSETEVIARLAAVVPDARAARVTLAIENHDRFRTWELSRIVQSGAPHVGICLDTVNSFGALEGPEVVVGRLGPLAVNVHLKDFAVKRVPYLQGFVVEGRPAGEGMLDVPWLLGRLKQFQRLDCNAIAELWVPPESTIEETIEKEAEWAQRSARTLRQWIKD